MRDINTELTNILELLLEMKLDKCDTVEMGNPPAWDSLKHIEIIMSIEQQFHISFAPEDIPFLTSKKALLEKIESLTRHA